MSFSQNVQPLVNIQRIDSRIKLDIRYATEHNFLGFPVYSKAVCYVHQDLVGALCRIQDELTLSGLSLKIYDGYRPETVQQLMWERIQDDRYVSNPAKFKGGHLRGTAVDVTLVDREGQELEMPTAFDNFTGKAHSDALNVSEKALQNRTLLKTVMMKHGFTPYACEWWHFDFKNGRDNRLYPALEFTFEELESFEST